MPDFKYNMDFVPVPRDFAEHIMPSENASYVKVYVYVLMLAVTGRSMSCADIAKKLGLIESDVVNAIEHWNKKGVFSGNGDNVIIKKSVDEELSHDEDKMTVDEVTAIINGDKALSDMCAVAQEILGKTLANNDIETLYWFYDKLGFSPEVITMILEYCVSLGKRNMKYIEKVAITWHENNITTMEDAQEYISRAAKKNEFTTSLCAIFGIDRKLSKTEKIYLSTWRDEYGMSADMVSLAYEYCVMATGKMSFPYINSILRRWHEQGITTIPEAERDHEAHKQQSPAANADKTSTDRYTEFTPTKEISEIEQRFMEMYNGGGND